MRWSPVRQTFLVQWRPNTQNTNVAAQDPSLDCNPLPEWWKLLWVTRVPVIKLLFHGSKSLLWTLLWEAGGWVLANGITPWPVWHGSVSKTELQLKPGWPNLAVTARLVVQIPGTTNATWSLEIHIQTGVHVSVHSPVRINRIRQRNF